jgi:hypothetical protein
MRRPFRLTLVAALSAAALLASGCGADKSKPITKAETEGIYIDLDELKYQVQMSRYLNANDVEDRDYLIGLPAGTTQPNKDETWFGVFMRVENVTEKPIPAANTFEIHDTQENVYRPVPLDRKVNVFAYEAAEVPPHGKLPLRDSTADQASIKGNLLLFKVKTASLQNRPLELRFSRGSGTVGVVDLDI